MSSEISERGGGDTLSGGFQILSLDGGGIRGLFSAALLAKWEEDLGCAIQNHFDLIVGTSTGGIIALGLGAGMRPREIVQFYLSEGSRIFPNRIPGHRAFRQFFAHKFSSKPLQAALRQCFGDKLLGHSKKRLVIPSYDLGQEEVRVFKTAHHERLRRDFKEPIWKVALATTAAPTYFPACREIENRRLIDGGIWANNPILIALTEAVAVLKVPLENVSILSLGTASDIQSRSDGLDKGGLWQWKRDIAEVIMRAQSVAATGQATLLLGQEKVLRVDSIVAKGVFGLDKLTPDKLLAAASHQACTERPKYRPDSSAIAPRNFVRAMRLNSMITTDRISELAGRKNYIAGLLEMACEELELPNTQRQAAERAYNAVGNWLDGCPLLGRFQPVIFPQGSIALGTTVRPVGRDEYDVDLICHLTAGNENLQQGPVKQAVGQRLSDHEIYRDMLEEIKRCWRLNYAKESKLHLDITPGVNNSKCLNGGLCVTDSQAGKWCPTNPKGYVDWFDSKSRQQPKFPRALLESREILAKQANVHPFPDQMPLKGLLRRCVQLLKRHRSILFQKNPGKAPISIILTTLAAKAFEAAALSGTIYETEFDLLLAVIERMPGFIERRWNGVEQEWWIPNETTLGENFAEKWNRDPELPDAFGRWHQTALSDFTGLAATRDQTSTYSVLEKFAGNRATAAVRNRVTSHLDQVRVNDLLRTGTGGVLTTGAGIAVPRNTFYGK